MDDELKLGTLLRKDNVLFPAIGVTVGFSVFAIMIAGYFGGAAELIIGFFSYVVVVKYLPSRSPSYMVRRLRTLPFIGMMAVGIAVIAIGKVVMKG